MGIAWVLYESLNVPSIYRVSTVYLPCMYRSCRREDSVKTAGMKHTNLCNSKCCTAQKSTFLCNTGVYIE